MVHSQNHFALAHRDKLVGAAQQSKILTQLSIGHPFRAATLDFAGNLVAGISSTVSGFCVPLAYPMAAYRGWVGGIVSIDGEHKSRFAHAKTALYYVVVLFMQILPYSLAGGAGINVGISLFRASVRYSGPRWWIFPLEPLHDAARIYMLVVPLFLIASLVEFYFVERPVAAPTSPLRVISQRINSLRIAVDLFPPRTGPIL
jgi:hypothetical protein